MNKLFKRLSDTYLNTIAEQHFEEVYKRDFEECFDHFKRNPKHHDNTLNVTFIELEDRTRRELYHIFRDFAREAMETSVLNNKNPFYYIIEDLTNEFLDNYSILECIEDLSSDFFYNKKKELLKHGLIDEEGDAL